MADYPLPPWLAQTPDYAGIYQRGVAQGAQVGQQQAQMQLMEQQQRRMEQQAAIENSIAQQKFHMAADEQARRFAAQQEYSRLIATGVDPATALLKLAPALGESLTGAAQLYKASRPVPELVQRTMTVDGREIPYFVNPETGTPHFIPPGYSSKSLREASIVQLPEVPGAKFIKQPSGTLTPIERPERDLQKQRAIIDLYQMMKVGPNELPDDPDVQARIAYAQEQLSKWSGATNATPVVVPNAAGAYTNTNAAKVIRWQRDPATGKLKQVM